MSISEETTKYDLLSTTGASDSLDERSEQSDLDREEGYLEGDETTGIEKETVDTSHMGMLYLLINKELTTNYCSLDTPRHFRKSLL